MCIFIWFWCILLWPPPRTIRGVPLPLGSHPHHPVGLLHLLLLWYVCLLALYLPPSPCAAFLEITLSYFRTASKHSCTLILSLSRELATVNSNLRSMIESRNRSVSVSSHSSLPSSLSWPINNVKSFTCHGHLLLQYACVQHEMLPLHSLLTVDSQKYCT